MVNTMRHQNSVLHDLLKHVPWASFDRLVGQYGADQPIYAAITAPNVNDITAAQAMPIEAGAAYVFDLGYYDYGWWAKMNVAGCRIVTRFKTNTPLAVTADLDVPQSGDRIGLFQAARARARGGATPQPSRQ
ncbi:MAG: hypothetical protein H7Z12_19645 [Rhodospirillaceae bacterium]|nr:hypothetical protein [Rhodospirillales bacterium]